MRYMYRLLALAAGSLAAGGATAQIAGVLQGPSQTPVQKEIGRVVEIICPAIVPAGSDIKARCDEIVGEVLGAGNIAAALDGLQNMGNEEDSVVGTHAVDGRAGRSSPAAQRVQAARGTGLASSISVNGRNMSFADAFGGETGRSAGNGIAGPWTFFLNGAFAASDRDATAKQSGFEADSVLFSGGGEYSFGPSVFLGASLGYARHDSELDNNDGTVDVDDYQIEVYGAWFSRGGWSVSGIAGVGTSDIEQTRNINYRIVAPVVNTALSETDSTQWWGSLQVGYDLYRGGWTVNPYVRLDVSRVEIDGFRERMSSAGAGSGLATEIDSQATTSLPLSLGVALARSFQTGWGTLTPQMVAEWAYEFENENDDVVGRFVDDPSRTTFRLPTDAPDRSYGKLAFGASLAFSENASASVAYQTLVGFRDLTTHAVQAGVRYTW